MRWARPRPSERAHSIPIAATGIAKGGRLQSWKEIAGYFGCGIRSVQRWEETEGLPVHRHLHTRRDAVYAYTAELDEWWTNRQEGLQEPVKVQTAAPPEVPAPKTAKRHPSWRALGFALAVLLAGAGIFRWVATRDDARPLPFASRDWVLVADLDNGTGETIFDKSLITAFTVSLEQSPHANVLPRARLSVALQRMGKDGETRIDEQVGREICLREHVKGLIMWTITKTGRAYSLSARLVDPQTMVAVRSYLETASSQDRVLTALGEIAARIRRDLGESLASIRQNDGPLPLVTTSSLEALRLFAEGNSLWRRGQHQEAVRAWESALNHDPDFAMAHVALADAYVSYIFNESIKAKEHYQKALGRQDRITDRERLYIQASYQHGLNHVDEAARDYRLYLAAYPDDAKVRYDLGVLLLHNQRNEEAIEEFTQLLHIDPLNARAWIDLATGYRQLDRYVEALANYGKAFELEPTWITLENLNHEYGFTLVRAGDIPKAREVFGLALAKAQMKSAALRSLALLDLYQGKHSDAKARLRQAILINRDEKAPLSEARNHLFLAMLLNEEGDNAGHLKELDRASEALAANPSPSLWLAARIGAAYARAGALTRADRILRALDNQADRDNQTDLSDLHLLEGEVALARGDYTLAIDHLQGAAKGFHLPVGLASLCHAYQKVGDSKQMITCYEGLIRLGVAVLGWEPQQSWTAAHADLAEAYVSRGDRAKAAQMLDELGRLWKDADKDLPLVKRTMRLQKRIQEGNR